MKDFWRGVLIGIGGILLIVFLVLAFRFFYERDRKIYEYMEAQHEIQAIREDIGSRPLDEFLEDPGVRGAADRGIEGIRGKRDEILQRIGGTRDN